ncbi:MAG: hypothetical protein H6668_08645 [Ardenticatenaceae bacterium]|nr:hypothetical protein [Ardenticatenaceae bacterium]
MIDLFHVSIIPHPSFLESYGTSGQKIPQHQPLPIITSLDDLANIAANSTTWSTALVPMPANFHRALQTAPSKSPLLDRHNLLPHHQTPAADLHPNQVSNLEMGYIF